MANLIFPFALAIEIAICLWVLRLIIKGVENDEYNVFDSTGCSVSDYIMAPEENR